MIRMMDRRNPYGSEGGYVVSRRGRDMARGRRTMDMARGGRMGMGRGRADRLMMDDMNRYREGSFEYSLADMTEQNQPVRHDPYTPYGYYDDGYYDGRRGEMRNSVGGRGGRDGHDYPMDYMGYDRRRDYRGYRDYAGDYGEKLTRDELDRWSRELMSSVEEKDRQMFSKENVLKKAREMGIKFEEVSEDEFYVTTLMMLTDYCKTLGTASMDLYLKLAKDWLWDEDADVQGGEKLAVYFDNVIAGE